MADNKNPNEKQPGEKPEGKHHYNPGNQSGKEAEIVPKMHNRYAESADSKLSQPPAPPAAAAPAVTPAKP